MRADTDDYRQLFLNDIPLMDVRAPVEFERGAMPGAVNIPLLDDEQRALVGTRYKHAGQDEAVRLGLEMATPEIRQQRLQAWTGHSREHPQGYLYCFRGGLRSRTAQQWMREAGIDYPLVRGGYKAMRQFLLDELEASLREVPLVCVGGLTGVGKTRILRKIPHHIDFEGLANHRGSAFGRDPLDRQPTVIDWENAVAVALLKHRHRHPGKAVFVEDEGRLIGRINIPDSLYKIMLEAPRAILEVGLETRIRLIREDYIQHSWPAYRAAYADAAEQAFSAYVLDNLSRIQKRLGGERYGKVRECFSAALTALFNTGEAGQFDEGIRILLEEYYDPMYRYQMEKKNPKIIFSGTEAELLDWATKYCDAA
jgi:tRNA 2-selenouridine synthase